MDPIFNADEAIQDALKKLDEAGVTESGLDSVVHDLCSSIASNINNGGIEEQVKFIIAQNGPDGYNEILRKIKEEDWD